MTQPLTWSLHGNDQLSGVLEKLDRTLGGLSRSIDRATGHIRTMGSAMGSAETPARRLGASADHASGRMDALGERLSSVSGRIRNFGAVVVAASAAGVAALGALALQTASGNEQAAISFELLLGDAKKASAFLAELQRFSAATPFEMPQLRTAASRLLAVGTATKDIIPLLTALGDATSGMGTGAEGISRSVTALTQMRQKTKVSGEEMLQLTEAGIPAWETLATVLGVDVATATKMVERRTVEATVMFEALQNKAGPAMQRLSGMMARQSTTLVGVWSTFKDNASQALAKFVEPALPALKRLVAGASVAIPKVLDGLRGMGADVARIFSGSPIKDDYVRALRDLGEKVVGRLRDAWRDMSTWVQNNREKLEHIARFATGILIPLFGEGLTKAIGATIGMIKAMIEISSFVISALSAVARASLNFIKMIIDAEVKAFGWIPLVGEDLKKAQKDFDAFYYNIIGKLDLLDGRTVTFNVQANLLGSRVAASAALRGDSYVSGRALGGPVWAGNWYNVNEKGPEQFYAATTGTIQSTASMQSAMSRASGDGLLGTVRLVLNYPDGKVAHEKLLEFKRHSGKLTLGLA